MARVAAILVWVEAGMERRRSRRMLMELTDSQLQDIGLSRADVVGETGKPIISALFEPMAAK
ncbi:DUF1127 domain-containing protein [Mesorhizobium sp. B2-3-7]|nr:DUF1127 domain-containing protein [Mesorhizobium sp. B2-3-8]TPM20722.1 DUF1127 domain-containing protein [Mesorhizobium sp. B2-3-7]